MTHVPFASVVGSLIYAMVYTRPDIAHVVGALSRYMSTPRKEHWIAVKRVFKYLRGMMDYAIYYQGRPKTDRKIEVHGFIDFDWASDINCIWFTSGYVFKLFNGAFSWMSRRKSVVALSTTKVEYMASTHANKEAVWL